MEKCVRNFPTTSRYGTFVIVVIRFVFGSLACEACDVNLLNWAALSVKVIGLLI